jgi:hypothetical protein
LDASAFRLWTDVEERRSALEAILAAWEEGAADLPARVARVDRAVVAALEVLGLPRGPVRAVLVEASSRGWAGRKLPDCAIVLDALVLHSNLRLVNRPDSVIRTWLHESVHARQPYGPEAIRANRGFRGYEEGLAEGLARLVVNDIAGFQASGGTFDYMC